MRRPEDLDAEEQADLETLCRICPEAAAAYELAQAFTQMVRERQPEALDPWLATARESALPELRRFAAGITRDKDAVLGALNSSWSNGQTEGQVNRLKMLKRQMFGRAKFDLLRQRVLRAS